VLTERKLPSRRGLLLPYKQSGDSGDRDASSARGKSVRTRRDVPGAHTGESDRGGGWEPEVTRWFVGTALVLRPSNSFWVFTPGLEGGV
jgi:hypothetical protein